MTNSSVSTIRPADKAKIALLALMALAVPLYIFYGATRDWMDEWFAGARAQLFGQMLVAILLESLPFVVAGSLVSGLLKTLVPADRIARLVPKSLALRLLSAAGMGVVLPLCNCGIVPVARRLVRKGVPPEMVVVYLLAGPLVNPIVIASTAVAFAGQGLGLWMPLARVLCGLAVAVAVGLLAARWGGDDPLRPSPHDSHHEPERLPAAQVLPRVLNGMVQDFLLLGGYLMLGAVVAATFQAFVPHNVLASIGQVPVLGSLAMMAMAFAMNLCSEADAFVAATFGQFSLAGRLAFLVLGPMLSFRMVAAYAGTFRRRMLVVLLVAAPLVLAVCELAGWLLTLVGGSAAK
jgi:uncharacterized protein